MRVSLVVPEKPGHTAGNVDVSSLHAHVSALAQELTHRGVETTIDELKHDPLERMGRAVRTLEKSWSKNPPDLVHSHLWSAGLAALAAMKQSDCVASAPVVQTFHALDLPDENSTARSHEWRRLEAAVARSVDRITATSRHELADLVALGARRRQIDVVPNGVDTTVFTPDGPVAPRDGKTRLITAGPMTRGTGFAVAISALAGLPACELVIAAGKPPGECHEWTPDDDPEADRLRRFADELGVADRLHLMSLPARSELPALLRSADIVVCTPQHDAPNTIAIEAMACGRPVIATAVGELLDVVIEGTTGVLVPPRDPRALARAITDLLRDPIRRDGYGLAGADRAQVRHSWSRIADEITRVYERAAAA